MARAGQGPSLRLPTLGGKGTRRAMVRMSSAIGPLHAGGPPLSGLRGICPVLSMASGAGARTAARSGDGWAPSVQPPRPKRSPFRGVAVEGAAASGTAHECLRVSVLVCLYVCVFGRSEAKFGRDHAAIDPGCSKFGPLDPRVRCRETWLDADQIWLDVDRNSPNLAKLGASRLAPWALGEEPGVPQT